MRYALRSCCAVVVLTAGSTLAQEEMTTPAPLPDPLPAPVVLSNPASARSWASADFLLWWTRAMPIHTAMLTQATNPADPTSGALGSAHTAVLLGGQSYDLGQRFGGRFTAGTWLDDDQSLGLEGSYLFIAPEARTDTFTSNGSITAPIVLGSPFFNTVTGKEAFVAVTGPGFAGGGSLSTSNYLHSGELNILERLSVSPSARITGLLGFRYINFTEDLTFGSNDFGVAAATAGARFTETDHFHTSNSFYGANLGLRGEYQVSGLWLAVTGKVALGAMNEQVNISGYSVDVTPGGGPVVNFVLPAGFFALPTNIGQHSHTVFAVVPEVDLSIGYDITSRIRATVGYTMIYFNNVARPGTAVDHRINPTQSLSVNGTGSQLVGPAVPAFSFQRSDFWAQGINLGLGFRF
jgi:hypothetical protein